MSRFVVITHVVGRSAARKLPSESRPLTLPSPTVNLLQRYTLPTQMATGGLLSGLGSCIAQHGVEGRELWEHEAYRTQRLMIYGGLVFAPIANRWHTVLNLIKLRGRWSSESLSSSRLVPNLAPSLAPNLRRALH